MVDLSNEVFETLGDGEKRVEPNEENAFIVQRRSIVCNKDLESGHVISEEDLDYLRPCPPASFHPHEKNLVIGRKLIQGKKYNESIMKDDVC
jgi:sialic acid synthase SpsE